MSHAQAIATHHRNKRLAATTGRAGKLADVERAAIKFEQTINDEHATLKSQGLYSEEAIKEHVASRVHEWQAEREALETIVANVEQSIADLDSGLPERNDTHRELCSRFNALSFEDRQVAITRAITGKDKSLAEALATEPMSSLMPADLALVKQAASDPATQDKRELNNELAARAQAARQTLHEVTVRLSGATR